MNIENMQKLRDQLARLPDKQFYMGEIIEHRECGTVACIAGWASFLNGGPTDNVVVQEVIEWTRAWLGLEANEAGDLFYGRWCESHYDDEGNFRSWTGGTRAEAIVELDRLIEGNTNLGG